MHMSASANITTIVSDQLKESTINNVKEDVALEKLLELTN